MVDPLRLTSSEVLVQALRRGPRYLLTVVWNEHIAFVLVIPK
jgi:hypothetical protein